MSRIGKIARLPKPVREELNRRLEDGEQQNRLVEWLNGREEVQAMLKEHYGGKPINEPNMSAWVQGGYEDWRRQEEALVAAGRMVEETSAVAEAMARQAQPGLTGSTSLTDRVSMMAALALGEQLMAVRRMEDGAEKRRAVLKLVRGLVRLRHTDRECERAQREAAQAERTKEMHEAWAENAGRRRTLNIEHPTSNIERGAEIPPPSSLRRAGSGRRPRSIEEMSDAQIKATLVRLGRRPVFAKPTADMTADTCGDSAGEIDDWPLEEDGHGQGRIDDRRPDELSEAELMQRLEDIKARAAARSQ